MAAQEQIQTARAEYLHVRAYRTVDSVRHVHCILATVLQTRSAGAGAAPQASVKQRQTDFLEKHSLKYT